MNKIFIITLVYIIALFVIGVVLVCYKPHKEEEKRKIQISLLNQNMSLSDRIDIINGKNAHKSESNALKNYFLDVQITLAKMNQIDKYPKIKLMSIICGLAGILVGAITNNYLLCLVVVPVFALIPFQMVKSKYHKFNKVLEEELETAIAVVTISYTRTGNFVSAVEECLDTLPPKTKPYFEDFLMEVNNINANVKTALVNLKTKIENDVFQQWVDRAIVCQDDKSAIPSLQNFVTEFADRRNIQNDLDAEAYEAKVEMYIMEAFVIFTPVVLYFMQKDAFIHLVTDMPGKITMFLSLLACVVVYIIGNKIAKPIVFRGNRE